MMQLAGVGFFEVVTPNAYCIHITREGGYNFKTIRLKTMFDQSGSLVLLLRLTSHTFSSGPAKEPTHYQVSDKVLYDNCSLLAPDGAILCTCSQKKAQWYLDNNLADPVPGSDPMSVKLRFEPSGRPDQGDYYCQRKENKCCCCGSSDRLVRKNVVPREYRKHFPAAYKDKQSHDVVLLCVRCHCVSNVNDASMREQLARQYGVPVNIETATRAVDKSAMRARSTARALTSSQQIPAERRAELLGELERYLGHEPSEQEVVECRDFKQINLSTGPGHGADVHRTRTCVHTVCLKSVLKLQTLSLSNIMHYTCAQRVITVEDKEQCDKEFAEHIIGTKTRFIGLDCEWNPGRKVSLMQVATTSVILLIRLNKMNLILPENLRKVLAEPKIIKLGINIDGDNDKLKEDCGCIIRSWLDLRNLVFRSPCWGPTLLSKIQDFEWEVKTEQSFSNKPDAADYADSRRFGWCPKIGMEPLVSDCFGVTLPKNNSVRWGDDWEAEELKPFQKAYAANDAAAALDIFVVLVYASSVGKVLPIELDDSFDVEQLVPQYQSELLDAAGELLEVKFIQTPEQMELIYKLIRETDPTFNLTAYSKHSKKPNPRKKPKKEFTKPKQPTTTTTTAVPTTTFTPPPAYYDPITLLDEVQQYRDPEGFAVPAPLTIPKPLSNAGSGISGGGRGRARPVSPASSLEGGIDSSSSIRTRGRGRGRAAPPVGMETRPPKPRVDQGPTTSGGGGFPQFASQDIRYADPIYPISGGREDYSQSNPFQPSREPIFLDRHDDRPGNYPEDYSQSVEPAAEEEEEGEGYTSLLSLLNEINVGGGQKASSPVNIGGNQGQGNSGGGGYGNSSVNYGNQGQGNSIGGNYGNSSGGNYGNNGGNYGTSGNQGQGNNSGGNYANAASVNYGTSNHSNNAPINDGRNAPINYGSKASINYGPAFSQPSSSNYTSATKTTNPTPYQSKRPTTRPPPKKSSNYSGYQYNTDVFRQAVGQVPIGDDSYNVEKVEPIDWNAFRKENNIEVNTGFTGGNVAIGGRDSWSSGLERYYYTSD
eukprot:sb/3479559/